MYEKVKVKLDATPSSATSTGGTGKWLQNQQNLRAAVLYKAPRGVPVVTPKFEVTCDGLKGCSIVFGSANFCVYRFMHIRRKIAKYTGKNIRTEVTSDGSLRKRN